MSRYVIAPLLVANFSLTCNHGTGPDLPSDSTDTTDTTEVLVSASVPGDVDGLSGVQLRLASASVCGGEWHDDAGVDEHVETLALDELRWSDAAGGWVADVVFMDVTPGCYDVVVVALGGEGWLGECAEEMVVERGGGEVAVGCDVRSP